MSGYAALALPEPSKLAQNAEGGKPTVAAACGGKESVLQPKYDGWRVLFVVGDDGVARGQTRQGNSLAGKMPSIEALLSEKLPPGTVLDGEAMVFKTTDAGDLIQERGAVASCLGSGVAKAALCSAQITYVVFDLLAHGGIDARKLPYSARRRLLAQMFDSDEFGGSVQLVPELPAVQESHDKLIALGYEGSVVKWLGAPYASNKRGCGWWKIKPQDAADAVILGFKPGTEGSSFDGMVGAIIFGQHDDDGVLVERGRCSGMDWDLRCAMTANEAAYVGRVIEIAHFGVQKPNKENPHGALLSPQFKRFRDDEKNATEVTIHDVY